MKKKFLLLLLILTSISFAQTEPIYLPSGTLLEGFENPNNWLLVGKGAYDTLKTSNIVEGKGAIKFGTDSASLAAIEKKVNFNVSNYKLFTLDVYIDQQPGTQWIDIFLSTKTDWSEYFYCTIYTNSRFWNGWNRITFLKSDFNDDGTGASWQDNIRWLEVRTRVEPAHSSYLMVDNLRGYPEIQKSIVIITFDDDFRSTKDLAKKTMDSLGLKGNMFVTSNEINGKDPTLLRWSGIDSVYNDGWDICNHTLNHRDLIFVSDDSMKIELGFKDSLMAHGYTRSANFFAYPFAQVDQRVVDSVKNYCLLGRTMRNDAYTYHPVGIGDMDYTIGMESDYDTLNFGASMRRGHLMVLVYHDLTTTDMPAFSTLMHFLKEKQDEDSLKVMTWSQYYNLVYLPSYDSTHAITSVNNQISITIDENLPNEFKILGNYPNPFNPSTTISFSVENNIYELAKIRIYNLLGELNRVLNVEVKSEGIYNVLWNGRLDNGKTASSGVYIYTVDCGKMLHSSKMILMK